MKLNQKKGSEGMYGKCKIHNVDLVLEESREYPGKSYPICNECRKEFANRFISPFAIQKNAEWLNAGRNQHE